MVENGQAVCKLTFERMLEEPLALYGSDIGSSYQQQEETLSRYFRRTWVAGPGGKPGAHATATGSHRGQPVHYVNLGTSGLRVSRSAWA